MSTQSLLNLAEATVVISPPTFWTWLKHQFLTLNLANIALLIAVIGVSSNINSNLDQLRANNDIALDRINQLRALTDTATAQSDTLVQFNNTLDWAIQNGLSNISTLSTNFSAIQLTVSTLLVPHDFSSLGGLVNSGGALTWLTAAAQCTAQKGISSFIAWSPRGPAGTMLSCSQTCVNYMNTVTLECPNTNVPSCSVVAQVGNYGERSSPPDCSTTSLPVAWAGLIRCCGVTSPCNFNLPAPLQ